MVKSERNNILLSTFIKNYSIKRNNIKLFNKQNSLNFLKSDFVYELRIFGIDGFYLDDVYIQPNMENSVDFGDDKFQNFKETDKVNYLLEFINKSDDYLFFEFVYDEK